MLSGTWIIQSPAFFLRPFEQVRISCSLLTGPLGKSLWPDFSVKPVLILRLVDLIKNATVIEMRFLRLLPAAEHFINSEELDFGK